MQYVNASLLAEVKIILSSPPTWAEVLLDINEEEERKVIEGKGKQVFK